MLWRLEGGELEEHQIVCECHPDGLTIRARTEGEFLRALRADLEAHHDRRDPLMEIWIEENEVRWRFASSRITERRRVVRE